MLSLFSRLIRLPCQIILLIDLLLSIVVDAQAPTLLPHSNVSFPATPTTSLASVGDIVPNGDQNPYDTTLFPWNIFPPNPSIATRCGNSWLAEGSAHSKPPPSPPCCLNCTIFGGDVQVHVWPTPAPTPLVNSFVDSTGFTYISPSVYVDFQQLSATNLCGNVGTARNRTILAFQPNGLFTSKAYINPPARALQALQVDGDAYSWSSFNPADLQSNCTTGIETLTAGQEVFTVSYNPCSPSLSVPFSIFQIDNAWTTCVPGIKAFYDPPRVINPAGALVPTAVTIPSDFGRMPVAAQAGSTAAPAIVAPTAAASQDPIGSPTPVSNSNSNSNSNPNPSTNSGPNSNANANTNSIINSNSNMNTDSNSNVNSNANANPIAVSNAHSNPSFNPDTNSKTKPDANSISNSNSNANFNTNPNTNSNSDGAPPQPEVAAFQGNAPSGSNPANNPNPQPIQLSGNGENLQNSASSPKGSVPGVGSNPSGNTPANALPKVVSSATAAGLQTNNSPGNPTIQNPADSNLVATDSGNSPNQAAAQQAQPGVSMGNLPLVQSSQAEYHVADQILAPGEGPVTVAGSTYSLAQQGSALVVNEVTSPLAQSAPVLTVGTSSVTPNSQPQYLVAGQTLAPGSDAITVAGSTISLAPEASTLVVNDITSVVPAQGIPGSPVLTIGNTPIPPNAYPQYLVAGQTLAPGAPPVTLSGTTLPLASDFAAIVLNGVTSSLSQQPTATPPALTIGNSVVSANIGTQYNVAGQALVPGVAPLTVAGTTLSGNVAYANGVPTNLPNAVTKPSDAAVLNIGISCITANAQRNFLIGGQILAPGAAALTISGSTISLVPSGNVAFINGVSSTLSKKVVAPTTAPVLNIGSSAITADVQNQFKIEGQTLTPGGQALTVSGTTSSLAPSGNIAVINGVSLPLASTSTSSVGNAVLNFGSSPITADAHNKFVTVSQTLPLGVSAITISGTTSSLASSGGFVVVNGITSTVSGAATVVTEGIGGHGFNSTAGSGFSGVSISGSGRPLESSSAGNASPSAGVGILGHHWGGVALVALGRCISGIGALGLAFWTLAMHL